MRMIYISCNVSMLNEIVSLLKKHKAKSYQIVEQASSMNKVGNPRLNNAVWPGYNSLIFINLETEKTYNSLITELKNYNKKVTMPDEKITVSAWKTDEFFWE
ncbi:MAG: hypothetical protein PHW82_00710 [Bacteroidales bacterium]|nr:hypothetical protein [Bacteroidales bacterium]